MLVPRERPPGGGNEGWYRGNTPVPLLGRVFCCLAWPSDETFTSVRGGEAMVLTSLPTPTAAPRRVTEQPSGADLVCESLLAHGVETAFGYPGGAALPLYNRLNRYPLRHVLVRHEQNAAHAAD